MPNRYLMDRAMRKGSMRDGRNPYGSRGGYVSSSRRSMRGRDRADMNYDMARGGNRDYRGYDRGMDMGYDYAKYSGGYGSGYNSQRGNQDGHYPYERYGEHNRPMDFEMYGYSIGGIRPMDYGMYPYPDYASEDMEKEWKEHLKKWCEELKRYDKFNMPKEQILSQAKQMGLKFENYNEEEFLTTYYMVISDDEDSLISNPQMAIIMAKNWLEDKDSKLKGAEKLSAYYYEVINAGEE